MSCLHAIANAADGAPAPFRGRRGRRGSGGRRHRSYLCRSANLDAGQHGLTATPVCTTQLAQFCGGGDGGMSCNCSASSLAASARHVGFMPFVLPVLTHQYGPSPPAHVPPPLPPMAYGGWYHWPSETKCRDDGTPVGVRTLTAHSNHSNWHGPAAPAPLLHAQLSPYRGRPLSGLTLNP